MSNPTTPPPEPGTGFSLPATPEERAMAIEQAFEELERTGWVRIRETATPLDPIGLSMSAETPQIWTHGAPVARRALSGAAFTWLFDPPMLLLAGAYAKASEQDPLAARP